MLQGNKYKGKDLIVSFLTLRLIPTNSLNGTTQGNNLKIYLVDKKPSQCQLSV